MRALRIAMAMCVAAALLSLTLATVAAHDDGDHRGGHQDTIWLAIMRGKVETPPRDTPASGNAYVNVHTNDGMAPPNSGPGDFPGGEIRGQLRVVGEDDD